MDLVHHSKDWTFVGGSKKGRQGVTVFEVLAFCFAQVIKTKLLSSIITRIQ